MPNPYPQPTSAQMAQMQSDLDNGVELTEAQAEWWAWALYGSSQQTTPAQALLDWYWPDNVRQARLHILLGLLDEGV
jgi:hypothetical protein